MHASSMRAYQSILVAGLSALAAVEAAHGQCEVSETQLLSASDGSPGDGFAGSVALDGAYLIVGAPTDDDAGSESGAIFAYSLDGQEETKLVASDGGEADRCGTAVDISGSAVIVGAPGDFAPLRGSAYIFRLDKGTWLEEDKLTPSDPTPVKAFGQAVSIDGDAAVIGAPGDNGIRGAAYVFVHVGPGWAEDQKLTAFDGQVNDNFGKAVAISGDVVLAGAPTNEGPGSAYVFRYNGSNWELEQKLAPADLAAGDAFGRSVALNGDATVAVIGASQQDQDSGAVYVYRFDGGDWNQETKVSPSEITEGDIFGSSVAIDGNLIVVGSVGDDPNGGSSGSSYVFKHDGFSWTQQAKLLPSNGSSSDHFGWSVDLLGSVAAVGAPSATGGATITGAAYTYDALATRAPDACECPWDLDGSGVGVTDLLEMLGAFGTNPGGPPDLDGDQVVGRSDILALFAHWGDCN